jgi:hypothetical protein
VKKLEILTLVTALVLFLAGYLINSSVLNLFNFGNGDSEVSEKVTVNIFFSNSQIDPSALHCDVAYPTEREVVISESVNDDSNIIGELIFLSLSELLKGPTEDEKDLGFFTSINDGVLINSIVIRGGTAEVNFSEELDKNVAGSCRVTAIVSQITNTVLQFNGISNVIVSIGGRVNDVLQP